MEGLLAFFDGLPAPLVYTILAIGSALENLVPPVPADTFVVLGGVLAGRGGVSAGWVFIATWLANVGAALFVYWLGLRHGETFFTTGKGRLLLSPGQMARVRRFYDRFGVPALFLTRFLPGLRAVVPVFAGVTRQSFMDVVLPLGMASAIWYGGLVWVGSSMGRRLDRVADWLHDTNRALLGVALVLGAGIVGWWWRTRRAEVGRDRPD